MLIIVMITISSQAQCPAGSVSLYSQSDVDQFILNYPNCTDLNGSLYIASNLVTDISNLSNIESINGNLGLHQTNCTTANFPNLTSVNGNIYFHQNYLLNEVNLTNLVGTVTHVYFHQNTILSDVQLCSLTSTSQYVYFHQNSNLSSLCLDQLVDVGGYFYINGSNLTNLNTLTNLHAVSSYLYVALNPNLTSCEGICPLINNNGVPTITIFGNPSACSSQSEVASSCLALPVDLIELAAVVENELVALTWQTASEKNNYGFEVQRSKNGTDWDIIGFIGGKGTITAVNEYRYLDSNPFAGINYYRLKQIDFNGAIQYSKIVSVKYNNSVKKVQVFPNPSSGIVSLQFENPLKQRIEIRVLDDLGREIWESEPSEEISSLNQEIEIKKSGTYFVVAQIGDEIIYERLIITVEK